MKLLTKLVAATAITACLSLPVTAQSHLDAQYDQLVKTDQFPNKKANFPRFLALAEQGHAASQNSVGYKYWWGFGVEKDRAKARQWYIKAANNGNKHSAYALGEMYEKGESVTASTGEEFKWYKRAAELGHSEAMYHVGGMYYRGDGRAKDISTAAYWFKKSADADHAVGKMLMADMEKTHPEIVRAWAAKGWRMGGSSTASTAPKASASTTRPAATRAKEFSHPVPGANTGRRKLSTYYVSLGAPTPFAQQNIVSKRKDCERAYDAYQAGKQAVVDDALVKYLFVCAHSLAEILWAEQANKAYLERANNEGFFEKAAINLALFGTYQKMISPYSRILNSGDAKGNYTDDVICALQSGYAHEAEILTAMSTIGGNAREDYHTKPKALAKKICATLDKPGAPHIRLSDEAMLHRIAYNIHRASEGEYDQDIAKLLTILSKMGHQNADIMLRLD